MDTRVEGQFQSGAPQAAESCGADLVSARRKRTLTELAAQAGTTVRRLAALATATDPLAELLGVETLGLAPQSEARIRGTLGRLVIANLAEWAFEELYKVTVGTSELTLVDDRSGRTDTRRCNRSDQSLSPRSTVRPAPRPSPSHARKDQAGGASTSDGAETVDQTSSEEGTGEPTAQRPVTCAECGETFPSTEAATEDYYATHGKPEGEPAA